MKVTVAVLALSVLTLSGCAPSDPGAVGVKPSTAGVINTPAGTITPGTDPTPTTGVTPALKYVRGEIYGNCTRQADANFQPTTGDATSTFPILGCAATGEPTCAAGFQLINETPVQMNCSGNPSASVQLCYFKSQKCVKLAGSDTAETYTSGKTYGLCLKSADSKFADTSADASAAYPITNCTMTAPTTCAAGFKVVKDVPVQMNCSSTPGPNSFVPCYWQAERCMRI